MPAQNHSRSQLDQIADPLEPAQEGASLESGRPALRLIGEHAQPPRPTPPPIEQRFRSFEKQDRWFLGLAMLLLVAMAMAVLALSTAQHAEGPPGSPGVETDWITAIGLFGLVTLFCLYGLQKHGELRRLRRQLFDDQLEEHGTQVREEQIASILETANDAYLAIDDRGIVSEWNRQAESMFGWSRLEARGRPFAELIIPERDRGDHSSGLPHFLTTGGRPGMGKPLELSVLRKDGNEFPIELTVWPTRVAGGFSFNAFVHDISERKRVEEEVMRTREAALEAARLKSEFIGNMSHEIRTPMTGVMGMIELALESDLSPDQRHYLQTAKSSADTLLRLLNDILDFSKIEAARLELDAIPFSLRDCLGDCLEACASRAQQKGLEVAGHIPPQIPDALLGDPGRLRQVILNLMGNAIKFTEHGKVHLRVLLDAEVERKAALRFEISDTGIGIPLDKQKIIFSAFTQADGSPTRQYEGTGLGLAICAELVELMGGRIEVRSSPGAGSTFSFTASFEIQERAEAPAISELVELAGKRVLVADDDLTARWLFAEMLRGWDMKPTVVESAHAALEALAEPPSDAGSTPATGPAFDLALVEFRLPGSEGAALIEQVKQDPRYASLPMIAVTAAAQRGDASRCRELGVEGYLTKPVASADLLAAIRVVLGTPVSAGKRSLVTRHSLRESRKRFAILVVEDDIVLREVLVGMLEKHGHRAVAATSALEALELVGGERFHLLLADLETPAHDRFELAASIREGEIATGEHLPIVGLIDHGQKGGQERSTAAIDGYVGKPLDADELFTTVDLLAADPAVWTSAGKAGISRILDRPTMLRHVGARAELLVRVIRLFEKDRPRMAGEAREALERGDGSALEQAAHRIKRGLGMLGAVAATEHAARLEQLAASGDLAEARQVFDLLAAELERLAPHLAEVVRDLERR